MAAPTTPPGSAYVFLGHGADSGEFNTRQEVPEGYTFVTAAECGSTTSGDLHVFFRNLYSLGDKIYEPEKYRKEIKEVTGLDVNVYTAKSKLPELRIAFPASFTHENEIYYYPSGVFKLPYQYHLIDLSKKNIQKRKQFIEDVFFRPDNILTPYFHSQIDPKLQSPSAPVPTNLNEFLKNFKVRITLRDLLKPQADGTPMLPPGVYYHFICRAYETEPGKLGITKKILNTRRKSFAQQEGVPFMAPPKPYVLIMRPKKGPDVEKYFDTFESAHLEYIKYIMGQKMYENVPERVAKDIVESGKPFMVKKECKDEQYNSLVILKLFEPVAPTSAPTPSFYKPGLYRQKGGKRRNRTRRNRTRRQKN